MQHFLKLLRQLCFYFSLGLLLVSCLRSNTKTTGQPHLPVKKQTNGFQFILDSSNLKGSILYFNSENNTYYSNNFARCDSGFLPASTFKIPNSIIALETGVIANDSSIIPWNGNNHPVESWNQDLGFRDAFQYSCVPCYREIARKIGLERMTSYLKKLQFGNMKVDSLNLDMFWLYSDSRITPFQQIDFLTRFYFQELLIKKSTYETVKRMMLVEQTNNYTLYAKTGLTRDNVGWYVGFFEKGTQVFFFATNIEPKGEFKSNSRKDVSVAAFMQLTETLHWD